MRVNYKRKKKFLGILIMFLFVLVGGATFGAIISNGVKADGEPVELLWEVDQSTNIYVLGIDETLDGGYLITGSQSSNDAHIEKVDKDGNFEWAASSVNPNPGSYYGPQFHSAVEVSEGVFVAVGSVYTSNHYGLLSRFEEVDGVMTETLRWMYHIDHSETVTNNSTYFTDVILDTDGDLIIGANTYISPGSSVFHALKVKNNPVCSATREIGSPACEEDIVWDVAIEADDPENTYGDISSKLKKSSVDGEFLFMTPFFPKSGALEASPTMVKIVESPDLTSAEMERIGTTMNYKSKGYTDFATLDEKTYIFTGRHCVEKRIVENGIQIEYGDFPGLPCDDSTYYSLFGSLVSGLQVTPDNEYLVYGQTGYNPASAKAMVGKYDEDGNALWTYEGGAISDEAPDKGYIAASDISDDGTFAVVSRGKKISKFKDNTLYYHVNYNLVGGVKPDGLVLKRDSALAGTTFNFTDYSTFGDYTLDGWYTDPELTTKFEDYDEPALQDLELYGKYYSAPQSYLVTNDKLYYTFNEGDPVEVSEGIDAISWDASTKTLSLNDYNEDNYLPVRIENGDDPVTILFSGNNDVSIESTSPLILDGEGRNDNGVSSTGHVVVEGGAYDSVIGGEELIMNGGSVKNLEVSHIEDSYMSTMTMNGGTIGNVSVGRGGGSYGDGALIINGGSVFGGISMDAELDQSIEINGGKVWSELGEKIRVTNFVMNGGEAELGELYFWSSGMPSTLIVNGGTLRIFDASLEEPSVFMDRGGLVAFNGGTVTISGGSIPMLVTVPEIMAELEQMQAQVDGMSEDEIRGICSGATIEELNQSGFADFDDCVARFKTAYLDTYKQMLREEIGYFPEHGETVSFNGGDVTFEVSTKEKYLENYQHALEKQFSMENPEMINLVRKTTKELNDMSAEELQGFCVGYLDMFNPVFIEIGLDPITEADCQDTDGFRQKLTDNMFEFIFITHGSAEAMEEELEDAAAHYDEKADGGEAPWEIPLMVGSNNANMPVDESAIYIADRMKKEPKAMTVALIELIEDFMGIADVLTFGDGEGEVVFNPDNTSEHVPLIARIYEEYSVSFENDDETVIEVVDGLVYGDSVSFTGNTPTKAPTPKYQYIFTGWSDGTNTYCTVEAYCDEVDTLPLATESVTYTAVFDKQLYTPASEWLKNQEYTIDEVDQAVFRVDIANKFFDHKVTVDGIAITEGVDYDITEGSTIVTLKQAYLDGLTEGEHVMDVYFDEPTEDEDVVITTTFTAKKKNTPGTPDIPDTGEDGEEQENTNEKSGDHGFNTVDHSAVTVTIMLAVTISSAFFVSRRVMRRK